MNNTTIYGDIELVYHKIHSYKTFLLDFAHSFINSTELLENKNEFEYSTFYKVVGFWMMGIFCLLGITVNIISFIVLLHAHAKSPMFYVLRYGSPERFTLAKKS